MGRPGEKKEPLGKKVASGVKKRNEGMNKKKKEKKKKKQKKMGG